MKVVICGGGISGLSAAYYASKVLSQNSLNSFQVILVEKSNKFGGWLKTNVLDGKGNPGPIHELGPRSVRVAGTAGNNTLQFVSDLNLEHNILPINASNVAAKNRLLYVNGQLHMLPNSLFSSLRTMQPFSAPLAKSIISGVFAKIPSDCESMHDVCQARFGEEVADYLISSFCRGVFAADSQDLSMKAAFPPMWKLLKPKEAKLPLVQDRHLLDSLSKSLLSNPIVKRAKKEKWRQWATSNGFQSFSESIASKLATEMGVDVRRGAEVSSLSFDTNNRATIKLSSNEPQIDDVDHVFFALPSQVLSSILKRSVTDERATSHVFHSLVDTLERVCWVDVAVVNAEFEGSPKDLLPHVGFGHLVPAKERSNVLGIVYDSCAFPQHDRLGPATTRLTCMMGGSWFQQLFGAPSHVTTSCLEDAALESVREHLAISKAPLSVHATVCEKCIPTYRVGHTSLVENLDDEISNNNLPISLVGASYRGVSVNDCILNSRVAVTRILRSSGLSV